MRVNKYIDCVTASSAAAWLAFWHCSVGGKVYVYDTAHCRMLYELPCPPQQQAVRKGCLALPVFRGVNAALAAGTDDGQVRCTWRAGYYRCQIVQRYLQFVARQALRRPCWLHVKAA